jgi:CHAT domain-containing protein
MRRIAIWIGVAGALAACQSPQQAAAPAAAPTASFEPGTPVFVAPPRTVNDLIDILEREQPDPAKVAERIRVADGAVPDDLAPAERADRLYRRSVAAKQLGRMAQRLADMQAAVAAAEQGNVGANDMRRLYLRQLDDAYGQSGLRLERLEVLNRELALSEQANLVNGQIATLRSRIGTFTALGRDDEATRDFERMRAIRTNLGKMSPRGQADVGRMFAGAEAQLLRARGRYRDAEPLQRKAVQQAEAMLSPAEPTPLDLQLRDEEIRVYAIVLRQLGRTAESEAEARRSLSNVLRRIGKDSTEAAYAVSVLARTVLVQGRIADAERLNRAAVDILERIGHGPGSLDLALARSDLAEVLVQADKPADAAAMFASAVTVVADQPELARRIENNIDYARALIETGRPDAALAIAQRSIERRTQLYGAGSYSVAEARAVSAIALFKLNDRPGAIAAFRAAMPVLLGQPTYSSESADSPRRKTLQWLFGRFLDLLSNGGRGIPDAADLDAAFQIADASHGQVVQEALSAAASRAPSLDPGLVQVIRTEQDARLQSTALEATLSNLLALPAEQRRADDVARLRQRLNELRTELGARRREIEQRYPAYARLTHPRPPTLEAARAVLKPGEALIVTAVTDVRTYVWAVPQSGAPAFAAVTLSANDITQRVARLRTAFEARSGRVAELAPFDVATAHELYRALFEPVKPGWQGARSLLVVSDGALAQLPPSVLVTRPAARAPERGDEAPFASYRAVPWLAREAAITQLPSVAALAALRALPPSSGTRQAFIGFGDPWFNLAQATAATTQVAALPSDEIALRGGALRFRSAAQTETLASAELGNLPRLPDTVEELRGIARALGADLAKDVLIGASANERAVKTTNLADRRVVAFATHGLVPGDLNGLTQPALALSAPQVANVEGDGLLTMDEILGLKLNADWVVLSACNTAAGEGAGAEALSGLGRAFFYAGTRALLASNWPVETRAARALTTDLFRRQAADAALARAEALRQAELALIDGPGFVDAASAKTVFSYAHPIFWAPFSLVGDGG